MEMEMGKGKGKGMEKRKGKRKILTSCNSNKSKEQKKKKGIVNHFSYIQSECMPREILVIIIFAIGSDIEDIFNFAITCKRLYHIISRDERVLDTIYQTTFPNPINITPTPYQKIREIDDSLNVKKMILKYKFSRIFIAFGKEKDIDRMCIELKDIWPNISPGIWREMVNPIEIEEIKSKLFIKIPFNWTYPINIKNIMIEKHQFCKRVYFKTRFGKTNETGFFDFNPYGKEVNSRNEFDTKFCFNSILKGTWYDKFDLAEPHILLTLQNFYMPCSNVIHSFGKTPDINQRFLEKVAERERIPLFSVDDYFFKKRILHYF